MTVSSFNLIDEPWIPVVLNDGRVEFMGLRNAALTAHDARGLTDPLATIELGLHRLMVAVVQDAFDIRTEHTLRRALKSGKFDPDTLDAYFEKWRPRFNLLDPKWPFLQTADLPAKDEKPLAALLPLLPSGTNAFHFHHGHEDSFGVSLASAARVLTLIAPFMTAGGATLSPSVNGAPPWYALLQGETLFETLLLNTDALSRENNDAPPAWRSNTPVTPGRRKGASLLEALTWQPRRIQLIAGGPGICSLTAEDAPVLIRTMKFSAGASCGFVWIDPAISYKTYGKDKRTPLRPQEGRDIWRDTAALGMLHDGDHGRGDQKVCIDRPRLVNQFAELLKSQTLMKKTPLRLTMYGMRTDMHSKVFEWHRDELSLPAPLVLQDKFHGLALEAMRCAEDVDRGLRDALKLAYPRQGGGNKAALNSVIGYARRRYWQDLRAPYYAFLEDIATLGPDAEKEAADPAGSRWKQSIRDVGDMVFTDAVGDFDANAQAFERQAAACKEFAKRIRFALDPPPAKTDDPKTPGRTKKGRST